MNFCNNLDDFKRQFKTIQGKMFLISCAGILFIGYVLWLFAWALSPKLYGG